MQTAPYRFKEVIDEICDMGWHELDLEQLTAAAWAYYYFSIQFRENLVIAHNLHPEDEKLRQLMREECNTSNLSPWPGVALAGERMDHDEYMRRTLELLPVEEDEATRHGANGRRYLDTIRAQEQVARALSIASYEDGGLERVFKAILRAPHWETPLLQSFKHFLEEHIRFDSDPDQGHGALSRHLVPDDRILPLWEAFRDIFLISVPELRADNGHAKADGIRMPETIAAE